MRKLFKALVGILAAVAMLATGGLMATSASAEEVRTGSITISNARKGQEYKAYKIFDVASYNQDGKVSYRIDDNSPWKNFATGDGEGAKYVDVAKNSGVVTGTGQFTNETAKAFADAALKFAKDTKNGVSAQDTKIAENDGALKFTDLPLGYYLVTSTVGTLVSLDTTNPDVTVTDKNETPTVDKKVQEGNQWGDKNDAAIGDTVNFKTTIHVKKGAKNYKLHDVMDKGLTFGGTVKVTVNESEVQPGETTWKLQDTPDEGDTFTVVFADSYVAGLEGKDIVVEYTATVNKDAVIAGIGNDNKTHLTYGDKNTPSNEGKTTTFVWDFNVYKYTTDKDNKDQKVPLSGATFTLSTDNNGNPGDAIKFVAKTTENEYRVATTEDKITTTEFTTDETGKFNLSGLDSGTYWLTETKAPDGYNKLDKSIKVIIESDGTVKYTVGETETDAGKQDPTVEVLNQSGSELPSTGGMGTTVLYVAGAVIVIAAALGLAITLRKRQNAR